MLWRSGDDWLSECIVCSVGANFLSLWFLAGRVVAVWVVAAVRRSISTIWMIGWCWGHPWRRCRWWRGLLLLVGVLWLRFEGWGWTRATSRVTPRSTELSCCCAPTTPAPTSLAPLQSITSMNDDAEVPLWNRSKRKYFILNVLKKQPKLIHFLYWRE